MNKKIAVTIAVVIVTCAIMFVGLKTILGDKATELPGEEHTEKILNIQEKTPSPSKLTLSNESIFNESKESGP